MGGGGISALISQLQIRLSDLLVTKSQVPDKELSSAMIMMIYCCLFYYAEKDRHHDWEWYRIKNHNPFPRSSYIFRNRPRCLIQLSST